MFGALVYIINIPLSNRVITKIKFKGILLSLSTHNQKISVLLRFFLTLFPENYNYFQIFILCIYFSYYIVLFSFYLCVSDKLRPYI